MKKIKNLILIMAIIFVSAIEFVKADDGLWEKFIDEFGEVLDYDKLKSEYEITDQEWNKFSEDDKKGLGITFYTNTREIMYDYKFIYSDKKISSIQFDYRVSNDIAKTLIQALCGIKEYNNCSKIIEWVNKNNDLSENKNGIKIESVETSGGKFVTGIELNLDKGIGRSISVTVTDKDNKSVLSGAEFELYNDSNCSTKVNSGTTDENGVYRFRRLDIMQTEYFYKQVSSKEGYEYDNKCTKITFPEEDLNISLDVTNAKKAVEQPKPEEQKQNGYLYLKIVDNSTGSVIRKNGQIFLYSGKDCNSTPIKTVGLVSGTTAQVELTSGNYMAKLNKEVGNWQDTYKYNSTCIPVTINKDQEVTKKIELTKIVSDEGNDSSNVDKEESTTPEEDKKEESTIPEDNKKPTVSTPSDDKEEDKNQQTSKPNKEENKGEDKKEEIKNPETGIKVFSSIFALLSLITLSIYIAIRNKSKFPKHN